MNDEAPAAVPAATETTSGDATQPTVENKAARAAIAGAVQRRGPGRPPKNRAPDSAAADQKGPELTPVSEKGPELTPVSAPRRKKPSGRKKTRKELAQLVRAYEKGELTPSDKTTPIAPAAPATPAPSIVAGNPEAKEKFAKGVGRFVGALSRLVARRRGTHWQFDADECAALGDSTADCLEATEELAPSLTPWLQTAAKLAPFALLGGVCYEIVDSRLEIDAEIETGKRSRVMPGNPEQPKLHKVD